MSDRPTISLTCLKLVSSYASHQARLTFSPSVRLPKQLSPGQPGLDLLLASGPKSGPSVYDTGLAIQQPAQAQLSPARPAQVPGTTSSLVRLPGSQQTTHGFAASWLRLASPSPKPAQRRLSPVCQGQVCLTCLRLASGQRPVSRV